MSDAVKSPLEMFYKWEKETPEKVFLRQPKALKWAEFTWAQVGDQARRVASYIRAQGYPAGSSIGIWSGNSMDWVVVDLAIMMSCLLYTSPSPRDRTRYRMPSSA